MPPASLNWLLCIWGCENSISWGSESPPLYVPQRGFLHARLSPSGDAKTDGEKFLSLFHVVFLFFFFGSYWLCLCHLHAAKRIVNRPLHVWPSIASLTTDPEPSCDVCVQQKEPYHSTAYTTHALLGCSTRSGNLRLCRCIGVIKLAAGVCLSLFFHNTIFATWLWFGTYLVKACLCLSCPSSSLNH